MCAYVILNSERPSLSGLDKRRCSLIFNILVASNPPPQANRDLNLRIVLTLLEALSTFNLNVWKIPNKKKTLLQGRYNALQ